MTAEVLLAAGVGLAAGAVLGWLLSAARARGALDREREARVRAQTQLQEAHTRLSEERALLERAETKLREAFKAAAADTLDTSNQAFLKLARESFDKVLSEARGDLGKRQEAIDGLVRPLSQTLARYEEHLRSLEKDRQQAYAGLSEQIKNLLTSESDLRRETNNLVTALRRPQVRGRWGEMTLRRAVELAGMVAHCDFTEQPSVQAADGRLRPDLVVHLPAEREIVVDAKVSLEAFLQAVEASDEDARAQALKRHADQLRGHMKRLAQKRYWDQFDRAPDLVVMFVPGEGFLAAAADRDPQLIEDGMARRVLVATPTTLVALLRAVAYGWRQERLAENAREISDLGRDLYERMRVLCNHLADVGKGLRRANDAYNSAVGSLEARVLPAARRFQDLGVGTDQDLAALQPLDETPRGLTAPEAAEGEGEEQGADDADM